MQTAGVVGWEEAPETECPFDLNTKPHSASCQGIDLRLEYTLSRLGDGSSE